MIYCSTAEEVNSVLEANPNDSIDIAAKDNVPIFIEVYGSPTLYVRSGVSGVILHGTAAPNIHTYQDVTVTCYDDSYPHIIQHEGSMATVIGETYNLTAQL